jgi:hypothetical protein
MVHFQGTPCGICGGRNSTREMFQSLGFRLLIIISPKLSNYSSLWASTIGSSEATVLPHSYDLKNQLLQFFLI